MSEEHAQPSESWSDPPASPDPPPSSTPPEKNDGLKTPDEWCDHLGLYKVGRRLGSRKPSKLRCWQHNVAVHLHGWNAHAHHANEPIRLSEEDYKGALKAAEAAPEVHRPRKHNEKQKPPVTKPHKGALSKYAGK